MNQPLFRSGKMFRSPWYTVIMVAAITMTCEYVILAVGGDIVSSFPENETAHYIWDFLDPLILTLFVLPALYLFVLRPMQMQQQLLVHQNDELDTLAAAFSSSDGIMITDLKGAILKVNPAFTRVTGYTYEEVAGKNPRILNSGKQDDVFYRRMWDALINEGVWKGEIWNRRKDGEVYPEWLTITAVSSEKGGGYYVGIFSDISLRKQAEKALIESQQKFHMLFDAISDAVFITGEDGKFLNVNRSACERLGYRWEELMQLGPAAIDTPEFAAKVPERIRAIVECGSLTFESAHVSKSGEIIPVELNCRLIEYEGRHAIMGVARDISERKRHEQALAESMRKLEEKEFAKTRFLAAAGHDMRQPVAAASLLVETLKATTLTQRQSELVERLDRSMGVFSSMLGRLLDISRFDSGLVKPEYSSCNVEDLLLWVDQNFASVARAKQLSFRLFFPVRRSPVVRTDIGLVQSVLMNLVSNAIKFTQDGGILVSARLHGQSVLVQVWDTGIGIPEADQERVFEEFYQVGNPQRSREAGLGLGLAICQRAMALLGSVITCHSHPGHGSVFGFSLPLDSEAQVSSLLAAVRDPQATSKVSLFKGKSVTLLEDDTLVAQAMCSLIEAKGGRARCYANAEEALESEEAIRSDYYIVDYMLGGEQSGIEFLNQLRKRVDRPFRAVLVSGDTSSSFIRKAEMFDWPVLHKPVDMDKLVAALGGTWPR